MGRLSKKSRTFALQSKMLCEFLTNGLIVKSQKNRFIFEGNIRPSPLGRSYKIRIDYKKSKRPIITIVNPKLKIPEGKKLPHVYPRKCDLCLYYPKNNEWTPEMPIYKTILPWASEWLYHYEIWLITDEWCGGGIHHENQKSLH